MLAFLKQARFHRHAGVPQGFEEYDAVVDIDQAIIRGVEDQRGWGVLGHMQFVGEEADLGFRWIATQERLA